MTEERAETDVIERAERAAYTEVKVAVHDMLSMIDCPVDRFAIEWPKTPYDPESLSKTAGRVRVDLQLRTEIGSGLPVAEYGVTLQEALSAAMNSAKQAVKEARIPPSRR